MSEGVSEGVSEGLLSSAWHQPFTQILISCGDIDTISEYSGVTPGVTAEYGFGLQGQGRSVCVSEGGSGGVRRVRGSVEECGGVTDTCSSSSSRLSGRVSERVSERVNEPMWTLLFQSAAERDEWKSVLLRGLTRRIRVYQQHTSISKEPSLLQLLNR